MSQGKLTLAATVINPTADGNISTYTVNKRGEDGKRRDRRCAYRHVSCHQTGTGRTVSCKRYIQCRPFNFMPLAALGLVKPILATSLPANLEPKLPRGRNKLVGLLGN
jgi:hypothetical protein